MDRIDGPLAEKTGTVFTPCSDHPIEAVIEKFHLDHGILQIKNTDAGRNFIQGIQFHCRLI